MALRSRKRRNMIRKQRIRLWVYYLLIILLMFMPFFRTYVTSDHMPCIKTGGVYTEYPEMPDFWQLVSSGRFILYALAGLFYFLNRFLHISYLQNAWILQLFGMALYALAAVILFEIFRQKFNDKHQLFLLHAAVLLMFINPFIVEHYVYNCIEQAIGILCSAIAVRCIVDHKYVLGGFCSFCAMSIYQTNIFIVLMTVLIAVFILHFDDDIKTIIKKNFWVCISVAVPAFSNLLLQKMIASGGHNLSPGKNTSLPQSWGAKIKVIISNVVNTWWNLQNMFAKGLLPLLLCLLFVMGIYILLKNRKMFLLIIFTGISGILVILPFSFGFVTTPYYPQRTLVSMFFSLGLLIIGVVYILRQSPKLIVGVEILIGGMVLLDIYYTQNCIMDTFIGQAIDYHEMYSIQAEIEEYEKNTGNQISYVKVAMDNSPRYCAKELLLPSELTYNHRIIYDQWAQLNFLNYVNGTNYRGLNMETAEYEKYVGEKDWDDYNPSEQLIFEGNILYWIIY